MTPEEFNNIQPGDKLVFSFSSPSHSLPMRWEHEILSAQYKNGGYLTVEQVFDDEVIIWKEDSKKNQYAYLPKWLDYYQQEESWEEISRKMGNRIEDGNIIIYSPTNTVGHTSLYVKENGWVCKGFESICKIDCIPQFLAGLMELYEKEKLDK